MKMFLKREKSPTKKLIKHCLVLLFSKLHSWVKLSSTVKKTFTKTFVKKTIFSGWHRGAERGDPPAGDGVRRLPGYHSLIPQREGQQIQCTVRPCMNRPLWKMMYEGSHDAILSSRRRSANLAYKTSLHESSPVEDDVRGLPGCHPLISQGEGQ